MLPRLVGALGPIGLAVGAIGGSIAALSAANAAYGRRKEEAEKAALRKTQAEEAAKKALADANLKGYQAAAARGQTYLDTLGQTGGMEQKPESEEFTNRTALLRYMARELREGRSPGGIPEASQLWSALGGTRQFSGLGRRAAAVRLEGIIAAREGQTEEKRASYMALLNKPSIIARGLMEGRRVEEMAKLPAPPPADSPELRAAFESLAAEIRSKGIKGDLDIRVDFEPGAGVVFRALYDGREVGTRSAAQLSARTAQE